MTFRWVILDIETTGLNVLHDKITEIAMMVFTEEGIEKTWHSLINPQITIPAQISRLTGINNQLVANAPCFAEIAEEIITTLEDSILVAHNARFDYGFLKNAFKQLHIDLKLPTLCTIKLFKKLYPALTKYSLAALLDHFKIQNSNAHRAQGDVDALYQLLITAIQDHSLDTVQLQAKACYSQSSLPSKLKTNLTDLPESPGVYLFYAAQNNFPLYIGKSVNLRQRVLSHFQADHSNGTDFKLAQQVERVEFIPTAGELSALLLESSLIKEKMPLLNQKLRRRKTMVGFKLNNHNGYLTIAIVREASDTGNQLYGSFRSTAAAKNHLLVKIKEFKLCAKLCDLDQSTTSCFNYQLRRCNGACINEESNEEYNKRVQQAMDDLRQIEWPYRGYIAIKEECNINQLRQVLVFDHWAHIGTVQTQEELPQFKPQKQVHDFDAHRIIQSYIKNQIAPEQLIQL